MATIKVKSGAEAVAFLQAAEKEGFKVTYPAGYGKQTQVAPAQRITATTSYQAPLGEVKQTKVYKAGDVVTTATKDVTEPVQPKSVAQPAKPSGWSVTDPQTNIRLPISAGVAAKLQPKNIIQYTAPSVVSAGIREEKVKSEPKKIILPQLNVTAESQPFQIDAEISAETVGAETFAEIEALRASVGFQAAQLGETIATGKGVYTVAGAIIAQGVGGTKGYKEYQDYITKKWVSEQRVTAYRMLQSENLMIEKGVTIIPQTVAWFLPAVAPLVVRGALASGAVTLPTIQKLGRVGIVASTAGVTYGAFETVGGIVEATPAGYERAGVGAVILAGSAYGLKKSWEATFPKTYQLESYVKPKVEYQTYLGEQETIKGEYPSYSIEQSITYGDPTDDLPKNIGQPDVAIYADIKGVRNVRLYSGEDVQIGFTKQIRFRISEAEGLYKPFTQTIGEQKIFYPKGTGISQYNIGVPIGDTTVGRPDIRYPFTFEKTGVVETMDWSATERAYETLTKNVPVGVSIRQGTSYDIFKEGFRNVVQNMIGGENIVITSASYQAIFLEPETRAVAQSMTGTPTPKVAWKTTGDFTGYKAAPEKSILEVLNLRDVGKVGGAMIDVGTGQITSAQTEIMKKAILYPQFLGYSISDYDKPLSVMVYSPADISSPLVLIPAGLGSASSAIRKLEADAVLGAELKYTPRYDVALEPQLRYEPNVEILPKADSINMAALGISPVVSVRQEPILEAQPQLQPRLEPKLQPKLQVKSMLETKLQVRVRPLFKYDYKISPDPFIEPPRLFGGGDKGARRYQKTIFSIGKPAKKGTKSKLYIVPKADLLSRRETEWMLGKRATDPKSTKVSRKRFVREFIISPLGLFAGRFPTKEMIKRFKIKL